MKIRAITAGINISPKNRDVQVKQAAQVCHELRERFEKQGMCILGGRILPGLQAYHVIGKIIRRCIKAIIIALEIPGIPGSPCQNIVLADQNIVLQPDMAGA